MQPQWTEQHVRIQHPGCPPIQPGQQWCDQLMIAQQQPAQDGEKTSQPTAQARYQCSREANLKQKSCQDGDTSAKHGHYSQNPTPGCLWDWEFWAQLGQGEHTPSAPQPSLQVLLEGFQCLERAKLKLFQGKRNTKPCLQINPQTSTLNKPLLQPSLPSPAPALSTGCPWSSSKGLCSPLQA